MAGFFPIIPTTCWTKLQTYIQFNRASELAFVAVERACGEDINTCKNELHIADCRRNYYLKQVQTDCPKFYDFVRLVTRSDQFPERVKAR